MVPYLATLQLRDPLYGSCPVQAEGATGGFGGSLTWAAVFGAISVLVAGYFGVVHRLRDKFAKRIEPDYLLLDDLVVAIDKLAAVSATRTDLAELDELRSRVEQAEQRFLRVPFGMVVAALEAYEEAVLPDDYGKKLAKKKTADEILELCRRQGAAIEVIRAAIVTVQRDIERRTKR